MKELITANLGIWSAAVTAKTSGAGRSSGKNGAYGIGKLRELILELAVRGKLVPQEPDDEPASELLKNIRKEKDKLIADGKIKKDKPLSPIADKEMQFDLPNGWQWVRLGSLSEIKGGKRLPAGAVFSDLITPHIYIQVTNMKGGSIVEENLKYIDEKTHQLISRYIISSDDLYITIAGTIGDIGSVPSRFDGMNLTENAAKIVFRVLNGAWLKQSLSSTYVQQQFSGNTKQLAQPKLALHRIADSVLALPPLLEQHRIIAKVDDLMSLCDQLETDQAGSAEAHEKLVSILLEALIQGDNYNDCWARLQEHFDLLFNTNSSIDKLKKALLQLAVMGRLVPQNPNDEPASELLKKIRKEKDKLIEEGKIKKDKPLPPITDQEKSYELPGGWEWVRLGEISSQIQYGLTDSANLQNKQVLFLRITDIQDDGVNWEEVPGCNTSLEAAQNFLLKNNDLVIARTGGTIGKSYLVSDLNDSAVFASYLIRIGDIRETSPYFKKVFLGSKLYWDQLMASSMGTGQPNVNGTALANLVFPLPPLPEQHLIVAKVDELMALCDQLKWQLVESGEQQRKLADLMVERAVA